MVHRIEEEHAAAMESLGGMSAQVTMDFDQAVANMAYLSTAFNSDKWTVCPVVKGDAYGHGTALYGRASAAVPAIHSLCFVDDWEAEVVRTDTENPKANEFDLVRIRPSTNANLEAGIDLGVTEVLGNRDQLASLTYVMNMQGGRRKLLGRGLQSGGFDVFSAEGPDPVFPAPGEEDETEEEEETGAEDDAGTLAKKVQINIDTSMARSGFWPWDASDPTDEIRSYVNDILSSHPGYVITGLMTHMGQEGKEWVEEKVSMFLNAVCPIADELAQMQPGVPITIHYANTRTIALMLGDGEPWECDEDSLSEEGLAQIRYMVRPGKGVFGLLPPGVLADGAPTDGSLEENLKPVLSFRTKIATISRVAEGRLLGYGTTTLVRDSIVATLPIGWADGYPMRVYENYGNGTTDARMVVYKEDDDDWRCVVPVMRNPNMNLMVLDLTDCPYFVETPEPWTPNDFTVEVYGSNEVTAVDVARWGNLPSPSLACTRVGKSLVPDIHVDVLCGGELCEDVDDIKGKHCRK
ncbi:Alanine racemase 2 [Seminavis robusta]|uniref:Alanine racemase 2 n=1 Tax=Seminavis robusta TaxID=568900 RepID=A0A9N8DPK0_9STRA|nr:Alanine racemase 2 [Seminavis robusta]|eukprot:Sro195_g083200.1 Alanine racemase 2 (522) ;mRNA; r:57809-59479